MNKNIFSVLTSDPVQLETWTLKSNLILKIDRHIRANGWSQSKAADVLGITQPRVSNMLNGNLELFSIDFLLTSLFKLGYRVSTDSFTNESSDKRSDLTLKIEKG